MVLTILEIYRFDELDRIENLIDQVEYTNTTSVVLFLKAIPATIELVDGVTCTRVPLGFTP